VKKSKFLFGFILIVLFSCTKDRLIKQNTDGSTPIIPLIIEKGHLYINEFVARGSQNANEFGAYEDWIEIYNPWNAEITLQEGFWYISDAGPSNPTKYMLPEVKIPAKGFLVIWADGMDVVETQIHTNFGLSGSGEHIVIYYQPDGGEGVVVDDYLYGQQESGVSEGRYPNGEDFWKFFNPPTIGASNN
jgi:hypothetical protein